MNLAALNAALTSAVEYKQTLASPLTEEELAAVSISHPYYGFVNVDVSGAPTFLMFNNNDDFVSRKFLWNGPDAYESTSLKLWAKLSKKSPVVLDIGAYTGIFSLVAASCSKARVLSFEPLSRAYSRLLINKLVNQLANIHTYECAVSNFNGDAIFNVFSGDDILVSGSSLIDSVTGRIVDHTKNVPCITIDSLNISDVKLMKIDTEGAEHLVIAGAKKTIEDNAPDILVEILPNASVEAILDLIKAVPYNFYSINDNTGEIAQRNTLFASADKSTLNTLISCKTLDNIMGIYNG